MKHLNDMILPNGACVLLQESANNTCETWRISGNYIGVGKICRAWIQGRDFCASLFE